MYRYSTVPYFVGEAITSMVHPTQAQSHSTSTLAADSQKQKPSRHQLLILPRHGGHYPVVGRGLTPHKADDPASFTPTAYS